MIGKEDEDWILLVKLKSKNNEVMKEGGEVEEEIIMEIEMLVGLGINENKRIEMLIEEREIIMIKE